MKPIDYINRLPALCQYEIVELIDKFPFYKCPFLLSDTSNKFARFDEPCLLEDWSKCPFRNSAINREVSSDTN